MDMDNELEEFDRTGTPSLIGQSIRGDVKTAGVTSESTSRASSKPNFKVTRLSPEEAAASLEELHQEGVLLQDEEELDDILDKEGHIRDVALDISEKKEQDTSLKPPSSIDIKSINEQEESDSFVAKDQEFIAPASSRDGSHSRSSSAQPNHRFSVLGSDNKPAKASPLANTLDTPEEEQEQPKQPKDIVNEYNEGHYGEKEQDEEEEKHEHSPLADVSEERQPRKPTRNFEEPEITVEDQDNDDSELASDSASASVTTNSNGEFVRSPERPHLARGDSYQNTVTNNDFNNTPPLNIGERRARTSNRNSNLSESSLNYLRSISRSRSRMANDRNAIGEDRGTDEKELKEEGALMGDHYDQLPDLEDAVDNALKLVQEEMNNLGFEHADIIEETEEDLDATKEGIPAEKEVTGETNVEETKEEKEEETKEESEEVTKEEVLSKELETGEEKTVMEDQIEPSPAISEDKELKIEASPEPESETEEAAVPEPKAPAKTGADGSVYVPKAADKLTYEDEPVYLYTSLAGGVQIAHRTNRLSTILVANGIKFTMRDLGTDVEAKKVWRRYSGGKTLPGIIRGKDDFIGNWEEVEEANENYEVRTLIYETA